MKFSKYENHIPRRQATDQCILWGARLLFFSLSVFAVFIFRMLLLLRHQRRILRERRRLFRIRGWRQDSGQELLGGRLKRRPTSWGNQSTKLREKTQEDERRRRWWFKKKGSSIHYDDFLMLSPQPFFSSFSRYQTHHHLEKQTWFANNSICMMIIWTFGWNNRVKWNWGQNEGKAVFVHDSWKVGSSQVSNHAVLCWPNVRWEVSR